jgi:predicted nuclease of predicted toxin-antitoxin system
MKFLADMGISPTVIDFLQRLGHPATHLHQQDLDRLVDSEILQKARKEGRILLTHDLDFGDLLAASGADLPSVIIFRLRNMRPENVSHHLLKVISAHAEVLESGAIITITEGRARIRGLPLSNNE